MSEISLSITVLISASAMFAGIAGTWAVNRYRLGRNEVTLSELRRETIDTLRRVEGDISSMRARIEEIRSKSAHELAEFKLEVTREFATVAAVEQVESRVIEEIRSLRALLIETVKDRPKDGRG